MKRLQLLLLLGMLLLTQEVSQSAEPSARPNVLFIVIDDLRPELGCYGNDRVLTPHIDRLARCGMVFTQSYCQYAICWASRASVLTGYRPDRISKKAAHDLRRYMPKVLSLPQHFRNHGYDTISIGKVYHGNQDKPGWTEISPVRRPYYADPKTLAYQEERRKEAERLGITKPLDLYHYTIGPPVECIDVPDNAYADGAWADEAIRQLRRPRNRPFFLAVGFIKPHLPFCAPKKYWDLYDRSKIPLPDSRLPKGITKYTFKTRRLPDNVVNYLGVPRLKRLGDTLDDAWTRKLIHGYYACTSYVDAQVGRVLEALEESGKADRTIVILWGDHGFKLGEYSVWSKSSNMEYDTHAPLILRVPGRTAGERCNALVEFVDIYPTLAQLCGLDIPSHCEGTSMVPLLEDPDRPWKKAAFSQFHRPGGIMGYSLRTDRWRYVEWQERKTKNVIARELYDQSRGPFVEANLAELPEYADTLAQLSALLRAGWRQARPPAIEKP